MLFAFYSPAIGMLLIRPRSMGEGKGIIVGVNVAWRLCNCGMEWKRRRLSPISLKCALVNMCNAKKAGKGRYLWGGDNLALKGLRHPCRLPSIFLQLHHITREWPSNWPCYLSIPMISTPSFCVKYAYRVYRLIFILLAQGQELEFCYLRNRKKKFTFHTYIWGEDTVIFVVFNFFYLKII